MNFEKKCFAINMFQEIEYPKQMALFPSINWSKFNDVIEKNRLKLKPKRKKINEFANILMEHE